MNVSDESTLFNLTLYLYHATERRKNIYNLQKKQTNKTT